MKYVLGTVQLGQKYGVANTSGQPSMEDSFKILDTALKFGINTFDTAWAYGTSEDVLGSWIRERSLKEKINIISKLNPHLALDFSDEKNTAHIIEDELNKTLTRLGVDGLDGYLCYFSFYDDTTSKNVIEGMRNMKAKGKIKNIGVTVYDVDEAKKAIELGVDYIQIAYNVFDQRADTSGLFDIAKRNNVTIFARSPFMQGLLLMDPKNVPAHLEHPKPFLEQFISLSKKYSMTQLEAALFFAANSPAHHIVFGVDSLAQLQEIINFAVPREEKRNDFINEAKQFFKKINDRILDPRLWTAPPQITRAPQAIIIPTGGTVRDASGNFHSTSYEDGDAFGVLGGYVRVEAAALLAKKLTHAMIVTTGKGAGDGKTPTHAEVMKRELVELGIPPHRIILEENSTSTKSSITEAFSLAEKRGFNSLLFVTNEYHIPRFRLMVEMAKPNFHVEFVSAEDVMIHSDSSFKTHYEEIKVKPSYIERLTSEAKGIEALRQGKYKEADVEDKKERLV